MSILAVFNLKKDFEKLKNSGTFDMLKKCIENQIILIAKKELSGDQKKETVVNSTVAYISRYITPVNPIIGVAVASIAPQLVQYLYDSLKRYVDGLTIQTQS